MKKLLLCLFFFLFISFASYNQYFSIEDIEIGRLSYLKPDDLENLQWNNYTGNVVFSRGDSLFEMNAFHPDKKLLLDLKVLNEILEKHNQNVISEFPSIEILPKNKFSFSIKNCWHVFDLSKKELDIIFKLPSNSENITLNPDGDYVCYTLENNIWLQNKDSIVQVTYDTIDGVSNGDIAYRNEFGIRNGIFWSPQGHYFAFYRRDQTQVSKYPLIDYTARVAVSEYIRYPMAGLKSEKTELWIYSIEQQSLSKLITGGDPEQYLTNLSWTPDERAIYVQHLNRGQDTMILKSYDVQTGQLLEEFFIETDTRYVEPQHSIFFSKLTSGDFYYQSNRDGYNHLYYYNAKNATLKKLTDGNWEVTEFLGFDSDESFIYFMANEASPLESQCYRLDRESRELTRLTRGQGTHQVIFNAEMACCIDRFSSYEVPNKISICLNTGETVRELLKSYNPVRDFKLGEVERGTLTAADGSTDLFYRLIKPVDFQPGSQYPVLLYVYGGPHVQLLTNSWMDRIEYFQQYMAQKGFVSFTLDSRGSWNRGRDFEDVVHRQLGIPQLADQMEGVDFIKSLPFIDTNRIGVHGWSFGGYMTIFLMLQHPEVFQVGVAGGPVIDWKLYEIMYTERYMDTPSENPEGYKLTNLTGYTDNLQGDLLIVHGAQDPVVIMQHSMLFLQACIQSNKFVDFFVYPSHEHNVNGSDRIHLAGLISDYFIQRLSR